MKTEKSINKSKNPITDKANTYILKEFNTIQQTETLKKELLSALNKATTLEIVGNKIKNIDITFIQLLLALKKSALKDKKQISFKIDLPEEIAILLEHNGLNSTYKILNN